jgi:hypothetical protein
MIAVLAVTLIGLAQDTGTVALTPDSPAQDSALQSYAPTQQNLSLLSTVTTTSASQRSAGSALSIRAAGAEGWGPADEDSVSRRSKAIEYSDQYYTRLKIHKLASYLTVPLFVAQYLAGRELWNNPDSHGWARDAHGPLAAGIAGLFAVNTVTGVWNLWDSRKDPNGRTRRWVHGLTMLAADVGFVVVGATVPDNEFDENGGTGQAPVNSSGASTHRNVAIGSMALAMGSYVMMLIWKD